MTKNGYNWDEVLSAIQKEIRRGNEYNAVFWAVEGESFNPKAVWNRLRVIASEDIGIANPMAPILIDVLEREYAYFIEKKEKCNEEDNSHRLFLVNAVLYLARSPKSRIVDNLLNVVYGEIQHEERKLAMPDYAIDKHTLRGRMLGRGLEDFLTEGVRLNNESIEDPYKERARDLLLRYRGLNS